MVLSSWTEMEEDKANYPGFFRKSKILQGFEFWGDYFSSVEGKLKIVDSWIVFHNNVTVCVRQEVMRA